MEKLEDKLVKDIFDNIRNFLISATIMAAGVLVLKSAVESETMYYEYIIGGITVLFSFCLFSLNAVHGWQKFSELGLTKIGLVCLQLLYALVFIEIVGQLWQIKIGL